MDTLPSPLRWHSAARTHAGLVRSHNEDACLELPDTGLWAVADGMGGHARGDVASRMIVDSLRTLAAQASLEQRIAGVRELMQGVNRQLLAEAVVREVPIIGSTVAVLLASGRRCACLWAGDSRIYLRRGGILRALTRDHSRREELRASGAAGMIDLPAGNLITRAVGATEMLDLDHVLVDATDGDVFLLCSDGLTNAVAEEAIGEAMARPVCAEAADRLVALALEGGGRDNISAVVVRADDPADHDATLLNPSL